MNLVLNTAMVCYLMLRAKRKKIENFFRPFPVKGSGAGIRLLSLCCTYNVESVTRAIGLLGYSMTDSCIVL